MAALLDDFRRTNTGPAYIRLRQALRQQVENGALGPGQSLPSERDLAEQLDLSRVTVRKALAGLVENGVLVQRHGAGTFVAERIVKPLSKMTSFSEDLKARGLNPRSVFLERALGEVTPEEAMALNLSPGSLVARLYRLRYAGDEPLAVERSSIPQSILHDPGQVVDSLYTALDAIGCRPVRALQRLRAVNLDAAQAKLLGLPVGSAALAVERRSFLEDGRLVEFTSSWYRGDVYDFVAELQAE
ncbi:MAG TPA: GntR family transcriptional regulator [Gammaproteobacteria bacterium]|jgi:GntR family transcriptional regulator